MTPKTKPERQSVHDKCCDRETTHMLINKLREENERLKKEDEENCDEIDSLLDKVQLIETERDELKKRVHSEYDRGIEDAANSTTKEREEDERD